MSFATITAFILARISLSNSIEGQDDIESSGQREFFDKALIVLFDFPDFSIISAYMLAAIVWAEAFFQVFSVSCDAANHISI